LRSKFKRRAVCPPFNADDATALAEVHFQPANTGLAALSIILLPSCMILKCSRPFNLETVPFRSIINFHRKNSAVRVGMLGALLMVKIA